MRPSSEYTNIISIIADCPDCGNANRESRRRCARYHGVCGGTGKVEKFVPADSEEATASSEQNTRREFVADNTPRKL